MILKQYWYETVMANTNTFIKYSVSIQSLGQKTGLLRLPTLRRFSVAF